MYRFICRSLNLREIADQAWERGTPERETALGDGLAAGWTRSFGWYQPDMMSLGQRYMTWQNGSTGLTAEDI